MKLHHSGAVDFACNAPLRKSCRLPESLDPEKALVATGGAVSDETADNISSKCLPPDSLGDGQHCLETIYQ